MTDELGLTINANEDTGANPIECPASMDKGLCETFNELNQIANEPIVGLGADAKILPAPTEAQPLTIK